MDKTFSYTVGKEEDGQTLGQVLRSGLGLTARQIRQVKFLPDGLWINQQREREGRLVTTRTRVRAGDMLTVCFRERMQNVAETPGELSIVYEDEDLVFLDKPAGMAVHPAHGHFTDTLANLLAARYHEPVRLIGRLDKDTSGLIGAARNSVAVTRMEEQRRTHRLTREYLALVAGKMEGEGSICHPLREQRGTLMQMCVDPEGKPAHTEYRVWHSWPDCSLVWLRLQTGRTHQIRVHMAYERHPLLGDPLYGMPDKTIKRTALHSWRIRAEQPFTQVPLELTALPPDDFRHRWEIEMQSEYREYMERLTFPPAAVEAVLQKADARLDVLGQRYMAGEITLVEAQEAIGEDYGAYMAFLVGCLPQLRRRYAAAGLPEELFWHTMMDLKYKLMECHTVKGQWGNFAFWWYDRFYKMTRFTLGRLQFEAVTYEGPQYTCGGITVETGDPVVNIHIPSAGPLTKELRQEAYQMAYEFFPACRKQGALPLVCHSWLLDPEYETFLPASSNLIGFQKDFDIIACEKQEEFKEAWRVFGAHGGKKPQELPRDTSMQRGFADFLSAGGRTGVGSGIMLWGPEGRVTDQKEEL